MTKNSPIHILIPAFKPTFKLVELIKQLSKKYNFIIINDGSGDDFLSIFNEIQNFDGTTVLHHHINQGKGQSLKTGFDYYLGAHKNGIGIVTADADGQHRPEDIDLVAQELICNPDKFILGVRQFDKAVPFRSQLGNTVTKYVFKLFTGKLITDTQTGLRAIPRNLMPPLITLKANRYDYELEMLLDLCKDNIQINEVPIQTIYEDNNSSSHFNPLVDSIRIYFVFIRFSIVSIITALIDYLIFSLVWFMGGNILQSSFVARVVAGAFNFSGARKLVFKSNGKLSLELIKYSFLVIFLMLISTSIIEILSRNFYVNIFIAKLVSESLLFIASFSIQRIFIFSKSYVKK